MERGFSHKHGTFTKRDKGLIALVHISKCSFASWFTIEVGGGPICYLSLDPPKWSSHCALHTDAAWLPLRGHERTFARLYTDRHPAPSKLRDAVAELCEWIDIELLDETKLKASILQIGSWCKPNFGITVDAKKWVGLRPDDCKTETEWVYDPPDE